MATSRPTLSSTGEKQHNAKNAQTGKPKGSKARSRNEMYMEKLDNSVSLSSKRKIESILSDVNNLGDVEKMLLYLRLPTGFSESDVSSFTKSSPSGPNSNREEHTKAYNWICSHLEESPDTSMPKQDVYEEYKAYCDSFTISAVCPADFGKIMKGVFPNMKRRRLGTRGKSRYCYSGIRKKAEMKSPVLPHLELSSTMKPCHICPDHQVLRAAAEVLCSWEKKSHCRDFSDIVHCAEFLIQEGHIPKESDPAKVFISAMEECGKAPKLSRLDQSQESWRQRSPEERRRETTHQLQKKLQQKKLVKSLRIEEEERKKNFGVQVTDINIENSYGNCEVVSQSKESTVDVDGEVSQESGGNLVSPAPGTSNTSNSKESPKKKLTPIQPKTVRNVHLIPIPIQPTDNTPLKLIYMPKTGSQFAVPANINIPGSQPLPGNPQAIISTQGRQTIRNKVIVTASQVIQTSSTKPVSTLQTSNGISDQQRKTINLQGAKVNHPVAAQQVLAVNSQWQKPTSAGNQGITFALADGTNIPMLQTSQAGIQGSLISSDTANQNAGAILANHTLQGMQNNQKHALILSGNNQGGLFSVQPTHVTTDMSASPESILSAGKAVSKEMVVIPTTNQLSSNIPPNAVELVIAQSNLRQCDPQQKYIVSTNTVQASSALNGQNQQTIATSVANISNLEAMLNQGVGSSQSETISNNLESNVTVSSIQSQDLNQFRPLLSRGNSLPSSLTFPVSGSTAVSHHTEEASDQCASNLLRSLTEKFKGFQEAASLTSKNADNMKDTQHNKHPEKDGKSSRLLEELLRERKPTLTPSKAVKPNPSRRNSQTRPKSVAAGMIESSKGTLHIPLNGVSAVGQGASSVQIATDASLYPSTSINKPKHNKMETVSGMSAAMMLPHEFRTKTEQLDGKGDSQLVHQQQQQGNNPVRVSFPSQGFTLIAQEGRGGVLNQNIMMAMPNHSHSQILSMIPSAAIAATSSQLSVGSPASNSGQLSSAPSTPLVNLGSPEAVNSRSSNSTPLSDVGSVPVSPAQTQQAQLFFVPIKQGQGLDPALISVNNKSPVKPKNIFTSNQKQGGALVGNVDAGTPLDLTLQDNVIQQQVQNPVNAAQLNLGRKRHHSGGLLMIKNSGSDVSFWQRTIQQQPGILSPSVANIRQLHTKTDMPPPLTLPYNAASFALRGGGGGKPTLAGRTINRGKVLSRKRYGSGPSVSVQATQQQTDLLQQADLNIPTVASSTSSNKEETERLRNLAKRSQSVPLPEMSESLQNFIISTNKGGGPTATYPEEIEKSLKLETVVPRGIHANLNHHFEARRNLSTQLVGMGSDQDQREASNDAFFNEILSEMTGRDENENARSTHLVGSTGSGNCASSQTEIVPNPDVESPWHRFLPEEQTLTQHVTTLEDTSSNSSLELQAFGLDNFPNTSNLDLMANL